MLGFRDHAIDQRTGRPQPHPSWLVERVTNWTAWIMALVFVAAAAGDYAKWGQPDTALKFLGGAVLIGLIAYVRHVMLTRKRQALHEAEAAYAAAITEAAQTLSGELP